MRCVIDSHIDLLINGSNTRKGEDEGTATKVQFLDQYIIFSGVPSDVLEHKIPESSIIEKTFSYHRQTKTLVLKMVLRLHERASRLFDKLIIDALRPMGLDKELGLDGKARVHSSQRDKEPACSYCPRTLPTGRSSRWPSMVVEVAYAGAQGRRDRVRLMSTRAGGWKIQMEMFKLLLLLQFKGHQKGTLWSEGGRHCNGQTRASPYGRVTGYRTHSTNQDC